MVEARLSADARDTRFVYGVGCTWFGNIREVGKNGGLPACPHCGGLLFQMDCEQQWWDGADRHELGKPEPGYRAMLEWARGKCFSNYAALREAYSERSDT